MECVHTQKRLNDFPGFYDLLFPTEAEQCLAKHIFISFRNSLKADHVVVYDLSLAETDELAGLEGVLSLRLGALQVGDDLVEGILHELKMFF